MTHVVLLILTLDRTDFTRHGLHLNPIGKEKAALLIGQQLKKLLARQEGNFLLLPWIEDSKDLNTVKKRIPIGDESPSGGLVNKVRLSQRPKKLPVTRSNDFLWLTEL
jgi:hypothetical protein